MESFLDKAIVLTGTIVPNIKLYSIYNDPQKRKQEYIKAIRFYTQFSPVFFLENSGYPILNDPEFLQLDNVLLREIPMSSSPEKGKGFQEFEMLDRWISTESSLPQRWIKVTGRYIYSYLPEIWAECLNSSDHKLLINQYRFAQRTDTALFYVESDFFIKNLLDFYHQCNDAKGLFVEYVLYRHLKTLPKQTFKRFATSLVCTGISGHTGKEIQNHWKDKLNTNIRRLNYSFDQQYIWLSF